MPKEFSTFSDFYTAILDRWSKASGETKAEIIRRIVVDKLESVITTRYIEKLEEERSRQNGTLPKDDED